MPEELRIIGVDPGSIRCGYGVIELQGAELRVLEYGVIEVRRRAEAMGERLRVIFTRLQAILKRTRPQEAAVESLFYARNAQALAKLAQARGVALLACACAGIPIAEYAPRQIKQAVVGRGNATKEQVRFMVRALLALEEAPRLYDASDALAVALCHGFRRAQPAAQDTPRTWKEFIERFPERVVAPSG